jgi:NADH:ubiquinone oxidoreductase subunit F (NADH-binding)
MSAWRESRPGRAAPREVAPEARALGLEVPSAPRGAAAERARESFFADLAPAAPGLRVCRGTSCDLAGAAALEAAVARIAPCRSVYCVGFCDRSPALLRPDGAVLAPASPEDVAAFLFEPPHATAAPEIRCVAPVAPVTRRLAGEGAADLAAAERAGVYSALEHGLRIGPAAVLDHVERSGERGRGGGGFPTGRKWRACAAAPGDVRVVVANGDEGDPGSFVDRLLLERDPHGVLEGLALCALAVGARHGVVYVRSEYPRALERMRAAVAEARQAGILGPAVLGSRFAFDVAVVSGRGSYVCGEETALLAALEGRRGEPRPRPPYPAERGLGGRPTVVNNVETLVNAGWIVAHGGDAYRALGTRATSGTKAVCLNHGFARPGIVEVEFGTTLAEVVETHAGGARVGTRLAAVWLGGPMGSIVPPPAWDTPLCYDALSRRGVRLGHAGVVALPEGIDFEALLVRALEFMTRESCGRCAPCALGSALALQIARGPRERRRRADLARVLEHMRLASLCAFGQGTPAPLEDLLRLAGPRALPDEAGA